MAATGISWCDETWNPFVGCTPTSPACANCYAQEQAARIVKMAAANGRASHYEDAIQQVKGKTVWSGAICRAPETIRFAPLRRRKPKDIFVGSMTDFWHAAVPRDWQIEAFAVAALSPQHRFLFLTKRASDMRAFLSDCLTQKQVWTRAATLATERGLCFARIENVQPGAWPLPNVALGVTAEDQTRADERIPELLATSAAWRFVSCEPLLGAIDLAWALSHPVEIAAGFLARGHFAPGLETLRPLDFVVTGGESGPNARFPHPDWVRGLRNQCAAAAAAFHFKQWGEWLPVEIGESGKLSPTIPLTLFSTLRRWTGHALRGYGDGEDAASFMAPGLCAVRVPRGRTSGHQLDGREHRDRLPARAAS